MTDTKYQRSPFLHEIYGIVCAFSGTFNGKLSVRKRKKKPLWDGPGCTKITVSCSLLVRSLGDGEAAKPTCFNGHGAAASTVLEAQAGNLGVLTCCPFSELTLTITEAIRVIHEMSQDVPWGLCCRRRKKPLQVHPVLQTSPGAVLRSCWRIHQPGTPGRRSSGCALPRGLSFWFGLWQQQPWNVSPSCTELPLLSSHCSPKALGDQAVTS